MEPVLSLLLFLCIQYVRVTSHVIQVDTARITCWTCPNKGDNTECNDWAPDRYCPSDSSVCQSVHSFHGVTGDSVRVDKRCVSPEMCQSRDVGCTFDQITQTKTCVSCCSIPYCNEDVAHDNHTAIILSVTVMHSGGCNVACHWLSLVLSAIVMCSHLLGNI